MASVTGTRRLAFFFILTLLSIGLSGQQRYISRAIIAYSGGAYERTVLDINTAFTDTENISSVEMGKAYYYRAAAKLKLIESDISNPLLGNTPYLSVYNDLASAVNQDAGRWTQKVRPIFQAIYQNLIDEGTRLYNQGNGSNGQAKQRNVLIVARSYIRAAVSINSTLSLRNLEASINTALTN